MPAVEIRDLPHTAVLWKFKRQDRHGVQVLYPPIEMKVRWTLNDKQVIDPESNTVMNTKTIFADREIPLMSLLMLGKLADLPDNDDDPTDLHQMITSNTTPDLKGRNTRFEYTLMKFSNRLPTVEE